MAEKNEEELAQELPECPMSGVGSFAGGRYNRNKTITRDGGDLSWAVHIREKNVCMYGVFSGFNGGRHVAKYTMNRMVFEVFSEQPITENMSNEKVIAALREKFKTVDDRHHNIMEELLTKRFLLKEQNNEANEEAISKINDELREGCSALIVIRIQNSIRDDLFILNCGAAACILISNDMHTTVSRLNTTVHDNENLSERARIEALNIQPEKVCTPTRAIGDYFRKDLFEESFKGARGPPVIAEPDIEHYEVDVYWKNLVLISDGVVQNLKDCNVDDIPSEVNERLREEQTPRSTAQSLVDSFTRKHMDAYSMPTEDGETVSSKVEPMTIVFVKLRENSQFVAQDTISSINSTMDATAEPVDEGPFRPYVDLKGIPSDVRKALQPYLLASEPKPSEKF